MTSLDSIDRKLLTLVQADGRAPYAELGQRVGLSVSAVNERLKKLQACGALLGYSARIDPTKVDQGVLAFVTVQLAGAQEVAAFLTKVQATPQILECHHVTAASDDAFLLKVRAPDLGRLHRLLSEGLRALPGVRSTRTMLALASSKETAVVPCDAG